MGHAKTCHKGTFIIPVLVKSFAHLGMWSKVSGKFAILYPYKIGGREGVRGVILGKLKYKMTHKDRPHALHAGSGFVLQQVAHV